MGCIADSGALKGMGTMWKKTGISQLQPASWLALARILSICLFCSFGEDRKFSEFTWQKQKQKLCLSGFNFLRALSTTVFFNNVISDIIPCRVCALKGIERYAVNGESKTVNFKH